MVLLGATGFTGRLTARALVARGVRPVLAGRSEEALGALADELDGHVDTQVADVDRPASVRELVEEGDVLVTTVGPFTSRGDTALTAAIDAGASYVDPAAESPFIRRVFEEFGPLAHARGCAVVTAFGFQFLPGNLAAAIALREAGADAARVEVGYFVEGPLSGGTQVAAATVLGEPAFALRDGTVTTERFARRTRAFTLQGRKLRAASLGGSEHFTLPRLAPGLTDVNVYGPPHKGLPPVQAVMAIASLARRTPLLSRVVVGARSALGRRLDNGGGPPADERSQTESWAAAEVFDAEGRRLAECQLHGPNAYDFASRMLAWAADRAANGGLSGAGALGPVEGFGAEALEQGCAEAGFARVEAGSGGGAAHSPAS